MDFAVDLDMGLIFIILLPVLGAALIGGGIVAFRGSTEVMARAFSAASVVAGLAIWFIIASMTITSSSGTAPEPVIAVAVIGGEAPGSEAAEPWTRQFGPGSAQSVAVDAAGDVYVAGYTVATAGPGQPWLRDALLRKYDRVGAQLWSREFGSMATFAVDEAEAARVAVDGEGNTYVAGVTWVSGGDKEAFLGKYDASGTELWTRQFDSLDGDWRALGVAVDAEGHVYVVGKTFGVLPGQIDAGPADAFLGKYGTGGEELWTRQFGSSETDWAVGVAVDGEGNVYVAGWTGGVLPDQVSAGRGDAFLRKYAPRGTELWTRQFGYPDSSGAANGVAVDAEGNVFVAGSTDSTPEFQMPSGERKAFLRKCDTSGGELWSRLFGETFDIVSSVVADGVGNVYVAGSTAGGKVIGDALLRKYNTKGEELWTRQFGSPQDDSGFSVAVDREGNVYVAGRTLGAMPGQTHSGTQDAFVVQLTQ